MCLTAEFEMGSGSGHTAQATRPAKHRFFWDFRCRRVRRRREPQSVRQAGSGDGPLCGPCLVSVCDRFADPVRIGDDPGGSCKRRWITRDDQVYRAISTGQLSALPRLHLRPIDVVVFHGPQGRPRFEGGFPLRCLQRLSRPYIAMLHCRWRDNSSTRGTFIPVLSY